jgi:hypothetical protein
MNFKVGDRVRVVNHIHLYPDHIVSRHVGKEGVILTTGVDGLAYPEYSVEVALDGQRRPLFFMPAELAPLTPPAADEWAADKVKQVCKPTYLEPVRTKEAA